MQASILPTMVLPLFPSSTTLISALSMCSSSASKSIPSAKSESRVWSVWHGQDGLRQEARGTRRTLDDRNGIVCWTLPDVRHPQHVPSKSIRYQNTNLVAILATRPSFDAFCLSASTPKNRVALC